MKKILLVVIAFLAMAAITVAGIYDQLEITKEKAKEYLLASIGSGGMQTGMGMVGKARSLPVALRVEGIKDLMSLAKEYTESESFQADYKKWRNAKLNPDQKTKIGLPKFGKILNNKIDNTIDKGENEKKYPSDAKVLVKNRLEEFLALSATVDFDAEVVNNRFTKAEYEKKDGLWKMCYRAGKEVVVAAREFAQAWLDELK